ncbi:hypothetical protein M0Q50_01010 [bacterium]|jgi:hypothetical protein|nr:hypothetical protein [bacterium]
MKKLKTFESYIQKLDEIRKDIIDKFEDCFKKWELKTFIISKENKKKTILFNDINRNKSIDKLYLDFEMYDKGDNSYKLHNLSLVDIDILSEVYDICENMNAFNGSYHLDFLATKNELNSFMKIMECENDLTFDKYIFLSFGEDSSYNDNVNTYEFQKLLFSKFPEANKPFQEAIYEMNGEIKINDKIKNEFDFLFNMNDIGLF